MAEDAKAVRSAPAGAVIRLWDAPPTRSAELQIFARGAHGFGMIGQGLPSDRWIDLFEAWLADLGFA